MLLTVVFYLRKSRRNLALKARSGRGVGEEKRIKYSIETEAPGRGVDEAWARGEGWAGWVGGLVGLLPPSNFSIYIYPYIHPM
jgi:hypothetical protein